MKLAFLSAGALVLVLSLSACVGPDGSMNFGGPAAGGYGPAPSPYPPADPGYGAGPGPGAGYGQQPAPDYGQPPNSGYLPHLRDEYRNGYGIGQQDRSYGYPADYRRGYSRYGHGYESYFQEGYADGYASRPMAH